MVIHEASPPCDSSSDDDHDVAAEGGGTAKQKDGGTAPFHSQQRRYRKVEVRPHGGATRQRPFRRRAHPPRPTARLPLRLIMMMTAPRPPPRGLPQPR